MKHLTLPVALSLMTGAAFAEDLRPAPHYYVNTLFALTMAEALATSCSTMGMDLLAAGAATIELQEKLAADGFDRDQPFAQMIDPAPALRTLQESFLEKYPNLASPDEAQVCAVAHAELEEGSLVGRYLNAGAD